MRQVSQSPAFLRAHGLLDSRIGLGSTSGFYARFEHDGDGGAGRDSSADSGPAAVGLG